MRTAMAAFFLFVVAGCGDEESVEGQYGGQVTGGYAGLGALVKGSATAVQLSFEREAQATVSPVADGVFTIEVDGARLPMRATSSGAVSAELVTPWEGDPIAMDIGGTIGSVEVTPTEGTATFAEGGRVQVQMRATGPPREPGASPASISWSFEGGRARQ